VRKAREFSFEVDPPAGLLVEIVWKLSETEANKRILVNRESCGDVSSVAHRIAARLMHHDRRATPELPGGRRFFRLFAASRMPRGFAKVFKFETHLSHCGAGGIILDSHTAAGGDCKSHSFGYLVIIGVQCLPSHKEDPVCFGWVASAAIG